LAVSLLPGDVPPTRTRRCDNMKLNILKLAYLINYIRELENSEPR
jgi:hypothetical protein